MKISVWDTYVKRSDGRIMHFDILVPDHVTDKMRVFDYGRQHLDSKPFETEGLKATRCNFCHVVEASSTVVEDIGKRGYSVVELANCN